MIYALDFGTSNSLLAAADDKRTFAPVALDAGAKDPTILRSLLYFPRMNQCFYGSEAIKEFLDHQGEGRLLRSIKKHLPIRSFIGTWIEDRPANLEDLIGFFLGEMRRRANLFFDKDVDSVVLGRPAKFSENEQDDQFAERRLAEAARRGGFKHVEFCPEPLAAAFAFRSQLKEKRLVLVADFGGGTSDFTVIQMEPGEYHPSQVLAIGGVPTAGDALDGSIMRARLARYFGSEIKYSIPFSSNVLQLPRNLVERLCSPADISILGKRDIKEFLAQVQRWTVEPEHRETLDRLFCLIEEQQGFPLFEAIEAAKRGLSESDKSVVRFEHPRIQIDEELSSADFGRCSEPHLNQIIEAMDETLEKAGVSSAQIDIVCCTGGTAKVAALRSRLVERFGTEKLDQHRYFHSVVHGLAERARQLM